MKILVCAKQVPNTKNVTTDPVTGRINREGVESILNPDDANALEAALQIKDQDPDNVTVTVISMGPPQAKEMLIECMAMGADDAILLSDRKFGGSDTWATSNAIAAGMANVEGGFDLILGGRQAIDGDTAQVGPQIAEHLGLPVISYAQEIKVDGDSVIVKRQYDDGYHMVKAQMPCLITALSELNDPRYMTPGGIFDAVNAEITTLGRADLVDVDDSNIGLNGSPTKIARASDKVKKGQGEMAPEDADPVSYIVGKLKDKHVI